MENPCRMATPERWERSARKVAKFEVGSSRSSNRLRGFESHPLRDPALISNMLLVIFNLPHNLPHKIKCA
jgi:hypothetical protein